MADSDKSPQDITEDALKLINTVLLPAIESGCRAVNKDATLDEEAKALFIRRYRLSIEKRLSNGTEPSQDELDALTAVANAHGKIAAAVWEFRQRQFEPPNTVDHEVLAKAAHVMEFECRTLMLRQITQKKGPLASDELETLLMRGIFCW